MSLLSIFQKRTVFLFSLMLISVVCHPAEGWTRAHKTGSHAAFAAEEQQQGLPESLLLTLAQETAVGSFDTGMRARDLTEKMVDSYASEDQRDAHKVWGLRNREMAGTDNRIDLAEIQEFIGKFPPENQIYYNAAVLSFGKGNNLETVKQEAQEALRLQNLFRKEETKAHKRMGD